MGGQTSKIPMAAALATRGRYGHSVKEPKPDPNLAGAVERSKRGAGGQSDRPVAAGDERRAGPPARTLGRPAPGPRRPIDAADAARGQDAQVAGRGLRTDRAAVSA